VNLSGASYITAIGDDAYIGIDYGDHVQRSAITAMRYTNEGFNVLYCGTWDNQRSELDSLAAEYHERCEAYDRTICTGPIIRNAIMPATNRERSKSIGNARTVLYELEQRAARVGYTRGQLIRAIGKWEPSNHA